MPSADMTVHKVSLAKRSLEYIDIMRKFHATACEVNIEKIERIQNPHLYQSYMVRKQKVDKNIGGNSEWQLFHGTDAKNVSHINIQGFNRNFCGANGKWLYYCSGRRARLIKASNSYDRARRNKSEVVHWNLIAIWSKEK